MSTVVITIPADADATSVIKARNVFIEADASAYGAARDFAGTLIAFFRSEGYGDEWVTMPHDAKGESGDAMREQRDALYEGLRAKGHTNPSVKWKQIKGYASEAIKAEAGETDETSGTPSPTRSPQLRMTEDLIALYKFTKREHKKLNDAQRNAAAHIASALGAIGVDISKI